MPSAFDGESLIDLATGERAAPAEIVVESGQHRAYIAPPWKLVWYRDGRKSELYHLENDPLELHDRAEEEGSVLEALSGKLRQWVECNLGDQRSDPIFAVDGAWTCYVGKKGER